MTAVTADGINVEESADLQFVRTAGDSHHEQDVIHGETGRIG